MVVVAQLVRASVCGTEGRGFEPHHPPKKKLSEYSGSFFYFLSLYNKYEKGDYIFSFNNVFNGNVKGSNPIYLLYS